MQRHQQVCFGSGLSGLELAAVVPHNGRYNCSCCTPSPPARPLTFSHGGIYITEGDGRRVSGRQNEVSGVCMLLSVSPGSVGCRYDEHFDEGGLRSMLTFTARRAWSDGRFVWRRIKKLQFGRLSGICVGSTLGGQAGPGSAWLPSVSHGLR